MKITFYGAAGEVTGSASLLETDRARVLVDFGLHQGGLSERTRNEQFPPLEPSRLNSVIVTHGHIDHIGRLPMLPSRGFRGPIFATAPTCELTEIMLEDSAELQESEARRATQKRARMGRGPVVPLYRREDAARVVPMLKPVAYGQVVEVAPGVTARWTDAGHILGSASIEVRARDADGPERTIVWSGDIGHAPAPMLRDPTQPGPAADLVIMESTYGDRDHRSMDATIEEFERIVHDAVWNKRKLLVPAFAVGRTQLILYHLGRMVRTGKLPRFPIYVDSPMAAAAVKLYGKYHREFDEEARALMADGVGVLDMPGLRFVASSDESRALNDRSGPMVIIAGSGMCTGGRILHHLRHGLWRRDVSVLIVGFQSAGSLGRQLVEKAQRVRIYRETIAVRATVHTIGGLSAHAGRTELLAWAASACGGPAKPRIVLTHGEDRPRAALAQDLHERHGLDCVRPMWGQSISL